MARKAKKKSKTKSRTKKSNKARAKSAVRKSAKRRAAKSRNKPRKAKSKAGRSGTSATSGENDKIPASPSGRIGERRPSNQPKPPGRSEPRELAQSEPDARFGDQRAPENDAREDPEGTVPSIRRDARYKNTDEGI